MNKESETVKTELENANTLIGLLKECTTCTLDVFESQEDFEAMKYVFASVGNAFAIRNGHDDLAETCSETLDSLSGETSPEPRVYLIRQTGEFGAYIKRIQFITVIYEFPLKELPGVTTCFHSALSGMTVTAHGTAFVVAGFGMWLAHDEYRQFDRYMIGWSITPGEAIEMVAVARRANQ